MDFESILNTIQPFVIMFAALFGAFLTAIWISTVIWVFRDIRSRSRDVFAQVLATMLVLLFFPLFPLPGLILYWILRPRETLSEVYERSLEEEALLQGIEERLACPGCNRRIEEGFMICPTCHTRLKKACPACGQLLHLRWNICPYCGATHTAAKAGPTIAPQPVVMQLETAAVSGLPEPAVEAEVEPVPSEASPSEPAPMPEDDPEPWPEDEPESWPEEESEPELEPWPEEEYEPEPELPAADDQEPDEFQAEQEPGVDKETGTLPFDFE